METLHAIILGIVEGLTEFLPISSTGHLILTAHLLGISGEGVEIFEVVIQAGALGAVAGLYRQRLIRMGKGVIGRNPAGLRLALNLFQSFWPVAVVGFLLHDWIKDRLFSVETVAFALAIGAVVMLAVDRWQKQRPSDSERTLDTLGLWQALFIGLVQCLSLWPGMSRAMVTLVAGMLVGLSAKEAAEYSFLLALPTLGAATAFSLVTGMEELTQAVEPLAMICGFAAAAVVAAFAIRGLIRYLSSKGLGVFAWYRLGLAALIWGFGAR